MLPAGPAAWESLGDLRGAVHSWVHASSPQAKRRAADDVVCKALSYFFEGGWPKGPSSQRINWYENRLAGH